MNNLAWDNLYREAPKWFRDAKFGLFFHWGPYSVPACQNEWYSRNMYAKGTEQNLYHEKTYGNLHDFGYKDFYPMMKGERFSAKEWAELVRLSGARYAGPVTEHSDNFSMWNSKVNPVNSVNYGPHRDIVGECAKEFRAEGIHMLASFHHQWLWGWFMSSDNEADVYIPDNEKFYGPALPLETNRYDPYRYPDQAFCKTWAKKICEVIDQYAPDVLYFDSRAYIIDEAYRYQVAEYYYGSRNIHDGIITYKQEDFPKGIGVYDFERGQFSKPKDFPWQSDDRLEDNITWCMVQEPKYKSSERIIHQLCDIVSKNGNLLLNVGPYADGSFHPDAIKILKEIGEWLSLNGEAIYETRPFSIAEEGPTAIIDTDFDVDKIEGQLNFCNTPDEHNEIFTAQDFRFTTHGDTLYTIALGWPKTGEFHINSLKTNGIYKKNIQCIELIGSEEHLKFHRDARGLHIKAPESKPCESAYVFKING